MRGGDLYGYPSPGWGALSGGEVCPPSPDGRPLSSSILGWLLRLMPISAPRERSLVHSLPPRQDSIPQMASMWAPYNSCPFLTPHTCPLHENNKHATHV